MEPQCPFFVYVLEGEIRVQEVLIMKKRILGIALAILMTAVTALPALAASSKAPEQAPVTVTPGAVVKPDSIKMSVTIRNRTRNDVTIEHTSGQKFDFQLLDANRNVLYTWSADKLFIAALTTTTIKAGRSLTFSDTLSGDAYKAIRDKIVYLRATITGKAGFIDPKGYEVQLKEVQQVKVAPAVDVRPNSVKMSISVTNMGKSDEYIQFTSGQKYDFQLLDANRKVLYTWSADKSFMAAMNSVRVKAGKTVTFFEVFAGPAYKAIKDKAVYMRATITGKANFIDAKGYEIVLPKLVTVTPAADVKLNSIKMSLTIENNTKKNATIRFTSGQKYDFQLLDAKKNVLYTWSADKSFMAAMDSKTIKPGKSVTFSDTLSGDAYRAIRGKIVYLRAYVTGQADFIDANGYELRVK